METLKRKSEHTMADLNNIDYSIRLARDEQMIRLEFRHLRLDNPSDPANFVTIDMTRNCALNFYNLQDEQDFLFVPVSLIRRNEPLRITLQNLHAHIVDSKNLDVSKELQKDLSEVVFLDGSSLSFSLKTQDISRNDCLAFLVARKNDLQEYQVHTATKNALLIETFSDIFASYADPRQSRPAYSLTFKIASILTAAMLTLSVFLNFSRCVFIEVFVACAFLGNVHIARNFSVFFAIRLMAFLAASIVVDLIWGYIEVYKLSKNYQEPVKGLRISVFVLSIVNVLIKCALIYFYNKVSKEDHVQGYLGLNDDTFWVEKEDKIVPTDTKK